MSEPGKPPVLVVADPERIAELVAALSSLDTIGDVLVGAGGDDTLELAAARRPPAVVVTAGLEAGDAGALIDAVRAQVPRAEVGIVLVGDDSGPIRTPLDALEWGPERFVPRPLVPKSLRFAVQGVLDAVALARSAQPASRAVPPPPPGSSTRPIPLPMVSPPTTGKHVIARKTPSQVAIPEAPVDDGPTADQARTGLRARWEALADSFADDVTPPPVLAEEPAPLPPPLTIHPRRRDPSVAPPTAWQPGTTEPVTRERPPTLPPIAQASELLRASVSEWSRAPAAERAPEPIETQPLGSRGVQASRRPSEERIQSEADDAALDAAFDDAPSIESRIAADIEEGDALADAPTDALEDSPDSPLKPRTKTGDRDVVVEARDRAGDWSEPIALEAVVEGRDSRRQLDALPDDFDLSLPDELGSIDDGIDPPSEPPKPVAPPSEEPPAGPDFARQLRAKMSMMAQRLFQSAPAADHAPRLDHSAEIDLAGIADEPVLGGGGVTEIELRAAARPPVARDAAYDTRRHGATAPGSWDTQVRERGLPEHGEIVRGVSDAAILLAKLFAQQTTGRLGYRQEALEKVIYFDQGRPVFAASNEPRDRMGELLVREGKITAAQYERCQAIGAESGRRMGEILVDFGYLKRRELLPAVRRHVEDIIYSLFAWDRGHYRITLDPQPSAERIRLSRHPAAIVLEGIRRKLDRAALERLVGPPSTVIEVSDRERLGGIVQQGDLAGEERAALAAMDGQADLAGVARTAGIELADIYPLAWGLCVLGLAAARRSDAELSDDSAALVGETDLAIDRERVRARWQLVTEADYFALLGVRRDATAFEIRRAYQSARRDFAADCFPVDLRRELARELDDIANVLDEAFRVLRDDRLRVTYLSNLVE